VCSGECRGYGRIVKGFCDGDMTVRHRLGSLVKGSGIPTEANRRLEWGARPIPENITPKFCCSSYVLAKLM
jgi:hypothetical protein